MALKPGQEKCVNTLVGPLAVSAGAGSGKTFTLTRRIVRALATGSVDGIDRVLAITFTTKAAAELKSRIKGALRAEGMIDQALQVDAAWISTIHGMCARILRAHALELSINPAFVVLDESDARPLLDAALQDVLSSESDFVSPEGLDALFGEYAARSHGSRNGGSVEDMVRTLVQAAAANLGGMEAVVLPRALDADVVVRRMMVAAEALCSAAALQKACTSRDALVDQTNEALVKCEEALAANLADTDVLALLNTFPVPGKKFGTPEFKHMALDTAEEYKECMAEVRFGQAVALLEDLKRVATLVLESYQARKRALGGLDNNDLLIEASRALAEHPSIAAYYADQFQMVMVDEFQDTDQLQIDMIKRMAGKACERLCTVGDAQQSIYRFRGADVAVYHRHVADVKRTNPDGLILLPDNFRSHADVLSFVDRVFEQPQVFGSSFMSLAPSREERDEPSFKGAGSRIDVQLITKPFRGVSADEACLAAAQGIAERFAALREAGHRAGEMVVLLGSTTRADVYADALRKKEFACVVVKGSIFNRAPEVRLMVCLAQAIANPLDSLALFEVLSSELFSLSADDFLVLGSFFDEEARAWRRRPLLAGLRAAAKESEHLSVQLAAAVHVVDAMCRATGRRPVARIMEDVVRDSGLLTRLESEGAEGQARAANILKAIRIMAEIERDAGVGVANAAQRFAARIEVAKEAPGALSARGGDFVRIMTVHASKGLEFPIVAVAELRQGDASSNKLLVESLGGHVYASLDLGNTVANAKDSTLLAKAAKTTFGMDELGIDDLAQAVVNAPSAGALRAALCAHEVENEAQEARRLLYVALTRAKEALVVSMIGTRTKNDPSGASSGMNADIQSALCGAGGLFPEGKATFDFGGTRPATFERIDLVAAEEAAESGEDAGDGALAPEAVAADEALAHDTDARDNVVDYVDLFEPYATPAYREGVYSPVREGVFSYSSIAPANVADEAERGDSDKIDVTEAYDALAGSASLCASEDQSAFGFTDEDESAWDAIRASLSGEADATDLGTAFHRLAQLAVLNRASGGVLQRPSDARVEALCRSCGLGPSQRTRLDVALSRWFSSEPAVRAALFPCVRAEVPFFQALDDGGHTVFLEGEIDLLATDDAARSALIVDYKTGGRPDEDEAHLYQKHLLQATCYAHAVLEQGYTTVEATFVRVEQQDSARTNEPQCVHYVFTSDDKSHLAETIVRAYRKKGHACR